MRSHAVSIAQNSNPVVTIKRMGDDKVTGTAYYATVIPNVTKGNG